MTTPAALGVSGCRGISTLKVQQCGLNKLYIVAQESKRGVARLTQEATHFACLVVVIHTEQELIGLLPVDKLAAANRTSFTLSLEQSCIALWGQAEGTQTKPYVSPSALSLDHRRVVITLSCPQPATSWAIGESRPNRINRDKQFLAAGTTPLISPPSHFHMRIAYQELQCQV